MATASDLETKPCVCNICNKQLSSAQYLKVHYETQHDVLTPSQQYQCVICDKKFFQKCHYEYHMQLHNSKQNKFSCKICQKSFTTRYYLKSHEEIVHHNINNVTRFTKIYYCKLCNKHFVNKSHKDYHDRTHSNKKETCTVCQKQFCSEQYLKKHVLLKHPDKFGVSSNNAVLYHCEMCERKFDTRCSLECHMQAHAGLKPIICDICGKGLRSKTYYNETHRPLCIKKTTTYQNN